MKKITIDEYFSELITEENSENEKEFINAQQKLNENITKDVLKLVSTLKAGSINPPRDFVFMVYFRILWARIENFYNGEDLDDLKGVFNGIMKNNDDVAEVLDTDRRTLN